MIELAIRLGIASVVGIIVSALALFIFSKEFVIGHGAIYTVIPITILVVAYVSAFGANTTISATNCSLNLAKAATVSLIPAAIGLLLSLLFIALERFVGIFAFVFNKAGINFVFNSNWSTPSIFGLAFFVFWGVLFGQIIAGGMAEIC
jgi:hypothetical protein